MLHKNTFLWHEKKFYFSFVLDKFFKNPNAFVVRMRKVNNKKSFIFYYNQKHFQQKNQFYERARRNNLFCSPLLSSIAATIRKLAIGMNPKTFCNRNGVKAVDSGYCKNVDPASSRITFFRSNSTILQTSFKFAKREDFRNPLLFYGKNIFVDDIWQSSAPNLKVETIDNEDDEDNDPDKLLFIYVVYTNERGTAAYSSFIDVYIPLKVEQGDIVASCSIIQIVTATSTVKYLNASGILVMADSDEIFNTLPLYPCCRTLETAIPSLVLNISN